MSDGGGGTAARWPEPVTPQEAPPAPYPVKVLPDLLGLWCSELAEEVEVDVSMAILAALASCSLALTRKARISLSHEGDGWRQPLNAYFVPVAHPSERKSPVYEAAIAPVLEYERIQGQAWESERALADERVLSLEARCRTLRGRLARAKDPEKEAEGEPEQAELLPTGKPKRGRPPKPMTSRQEVLDELEAATRELVDARRALPRPPELLISDVHPHTLARHLDEVGGVSGVFTDEGDGPFSLLGRDDDVHFGCWLPGYDGSWSRTKRKDAKFSGAPHLAALVFCQPALLSSLGAKPAAHGLGFTARWWYAVCEERAGKRTNRTSPMGGSTHHNFGLLLQKLLQLPRKEPEPVLHLEAEAREPFLAWRDELEGMQGRRTGQHPALAQWVGKHAARVGRLAGVLHLVQMANEPGGGLDQQVSRRTMEAAIALGRVGVEHARAAFGLMGQDATSGGAITVVRWLRAHQAVLRRGDKRGVMIGVRDLLAGLKYQFPGREALDPVLRRLVDWGYFRGLEAGRPTDLQRAFLVHPQLTTADELLTDLSAEIPKTS